MDVFLPRHRQRRDTVEFFFFRENRDLQATKRFVAKALESHERPERTVIGGSPTNSEAIIACDSENRLLHRSRRSLMAIRIRQSQYLNNCIQHDHRRVKRRIRSMLGFKSFTRVATILPSTRHRHWSNSSIFSLLEGRSGFSSKYQAQVWDRTRVMRSILAPWFAAIQSRHDGVAFLMQRSRGQDEIEFNRARASS